MFSFHYTFSPYILYHVCNGREQITGIEPVSHPWQGRILTFRPYLHISLRSDLNAQPSDYETDALPLRHAGGSVSCRGEIRTRVTLLMREGWGRSRPLCNNRKRKTRTSLLLPESSVHTLTLRSRLIGREGVEPSVSCSPTAYKVAALTAELPPCIFWTVPVFVLLLS